MESMRLRWSSGKGHGSNCGRHLMGPSTSTLPHFQPVVRCRLPCNSLQCSLYFAVFDPVLSCSSP